MIFIILAIPSRFLESLINMLGGPIIAVLITSCSILFGWLSYHLVYPVWRRLLSVLHLYPRSLVINNLEKMIKTNDLRPNDLWSFFLWNYCKDSIRERVKTLANYGHSLYMVSFTFIIFPLIYTTSRLAIDPNTLLVYLCTSLLPMEVCPNTIPCLENLLAIFSLSVGTILLHFGYRRVQYAENVQWLIFRTSRDEILKIFEKANIMKKSAKNPHIL